MDVLEVSGSNHSKAYAEIINLINMANNHREFCNNEHCGVQLYHAKNTAMRLLAHCWVTEKEDAVLKIQATRWH